jgi:catalase
VAGALDGVRDNVLRRAFWYWSKVDAEIGKRIEENVRAAAGDAIPGVADEEKDQVGQPLPEAGVTAP